MKAMLLAAGEGRRMLPLTLATPKPLLPVAGIPLIVHHLRALQSAGIEEVVINVSYLAEKIEGALGNGSHFGLNIIYSREPEPLETAGGILHAMTLLGEAPFLLLNGDIWTDYSLSNLVNTSLPENTDAHLVLVQNPDHHPAGDFMIGPGGKLLAKTHLGFTYSGVALLRASAVSQCPSLRRKFPLREVFADLILKQRITGEFYEGYWLDVGTPARLNELNSRFTEDGFK